MIHQIINKLFSTNTYVCVLENNNCIIIDPGSDFETIDDFDENITRVCIYIK